jgi:hypothetical protein
VLPAGRAKAEGPGSPGLTLGACKKADHVHEHERVNVHADVIVHVLVDGCCRCSRFGSHNYQTPNA